MREWRALRHTLAELAASADHEPLLALAAAPDGTSVLWELSALPATADEPATYVLRGHGTLQPFEADDAAAASRRSSETTTASRRRSSETTTESRRLSSETAKHGSQQQQQQQQQRLDSIKPVHSRSSDQLLDRSSRSSDVAALLEERRASVTDPLDLRRMHAVLGYYDVECGARAVHRLSATSEMADALTDSTSSANDDAASDGGVAQKENSTAGAGTSSGGTNDDDSDGRCDDDKARKSRSPHSHSSNASEWRATSPLLMVAESASSNSALARAIKRSRLSPVSAVNAALPAMRRRSETHAVLSHHADEARRKLQMLQRERSAYLPVRRISSATARGGRLAQSARTPIQTLGNMPDAAQSSSSASASMRSAVTGARSSPPLPARNSRNKSSKSSQNDRRASASADTVTTVQLQRFDRANVLRLESLSHSVRFLLAVAPCQSVAKLTAVCAAANVVRVQGEFERHDLLRQRV